LGKEEILSKFNIKNYNNRLEELLDKKKFSEDSKNLLLNVLYKIDVTYNDYNIVKSNALLKKEIIEEIIDIIKNECNEIEVIKPKATEDIFNKKYSIIKEKGKIITFSNVNIIMNALFELSSKKFKIKRNYSIIKKPVEEMLNIGWKLSKVEIIRDFDGWNWNIENRLIDNVTYNLVYQNICILLGERFIENIMDNKKDVIKEIETQLDAIFGFEFKNKFCVLIYKICILEYLKQNQNKIAQLENFKKSIITELKNMENKKQYLQNLAERKKNLSKRIKVIDKILNNRELIKNELIKYNNDNKENKVSNLSDFSEKLLEERKKTIKEYDECSELMKPTNYVEKKTELQEKVNIFGDIELENIKKDAILCEIKLQEQFLEALKIMIIRATTKKEIIDLIFKLRYYKMLPIENGKIKDVKLLVKKIKEIEKKLITKACNLNIITIISSKVNDNYNIISKIFESKIINLEKISIEFKNKGEKTLLKIYDEDVLDNIIEMDAIEELKIKCNKKIKIFI